MVYPHKWSPISCRFSAGSAVGRSQDRESSLARDRRSIVHFGICWCTPRVWCADVSRSCEAIDTLHCRQLGYEKTSFPNLLGHAGPHSAAEAWWKLRNVARSVHCSEQLLTFGCSVIYPKCVHDHNSSVAIGPCRSLCECWWYPIYISYNIFISSSRTNAL